MSVRRVYLGYYPTTVDIIFLWILASAGLYVVVTPSGEKLSKKIYLVLHKTTSTDCFLIILDVHDVSGRTEIIIDVQNFMEVIFIFIIECQILQTYLLFHSLVLEHQFNGLWKLLEIR